MSDEHDPAATGCYGHPLVQTPHLDRLARQGVMFDSAYCNSPMCVPSRMSFLTGRYGWEIGVYDNGSPLGSEIPTFAHYFEAAGYDAVLCGRMHMVGPDRLHGFGRRLFDDMTEWMGFDQKPPRTPEWRRRSNSHVTECGPGRPWWLDYDRTVIDLSVRFLESQARRPSSRPWLLVSGLMYPHFPLWAPQEYLDLYPPERIPLPNLGGETLENQHPVIAHLRRAMRNDEPLPDELTRQAIASYYALITLTDTHVGRLIEAVDSSPLRENTVIIYTSDHGEMAGQHGIWQKQCFYEPSVRVPLIVRMPGGPQGLRASEDVSLVDIMPTLLDLADIEPPPGLRGRPLDLTGLRRPFGPETRPIFSEYHAQGMLNAGYMVKKGRFKYNYYVGAQPQLFDLEADPGEFHDLAADLSYAPVRAELHAELLRILDPEAVDRQAKANQAIDGIRRAYEKARGLVGRT